MSAAAGPAGAAAGVASTVNANGRDLAVKRSLREQFEDWCFADASNKKRMFMLTFSIKDRVFKIPLTIEYSGFEGDTEKKFTIMLGTKNHFTKNCITLEGACYEGKFEVIQTLLFKDEKDNHCFDPMLSPESLPPGISQLNILATLLTKINLILTPEEANLSDALITEPELDLPYLSAFRLLRGEPTPYEKYGYRSPIFLDTGINLFDHLRTLAQTKTYKSILDYMKEKDKKIAEEFSAFLNTNYPEDFKSKNLDKPIAEIMKNILYVQTNKKFHRLFWVDLLFAILTGGASYGKIGQLVLDPTSEVWLAWDKTLQLISLTPIARGGRRSRRHPRKNRRRYSRRRKNPANK